MKRLAAIMMFASWLLYGAMPAMAMPAHSSAPQPAAATATQDHARHHGMTSEATPAEATGHQHDNAQNPCPHGNGKTCMAPFCAACLVLLPEITFADTGRFVHLNPEPEAGPALVAPASAPPTPPPRA